MLDNKCKDVAEYHFGEIIDWNFQTSMYQMLYRVIYHIPDHHLKVIAKLYNNKDISNITSQLEDAILDVLKSKGII